MWTCMAPDVADRVGGHSKWDGGDQRFRFIKSLLCLKKKGYDFSIFFFYSEKEQMS